MDLNDKYCPPFYVIDMPLDKNGDGPEMESPAQMTYEVWDQVTIDLCVCSDKETAFLICDLLNRSSNEKSP